MRAKKMSELIELEKEEDKAKELFNEGEKRDTELCLVLGLDYTSSGFWTEILPEIKRIKEKADRYDAQEKGAK